MNHLSGNVSFLFSSGYFHIFSDAPADFSVLPRILFCIFPSAYEKSAAFSIRIIRFLRFFRFVGIIFPAFFMWSWENFLSVSIIFLLSRNFFKRKICFFLFLSSGFQACLSWQSGYFSSFFRGETEKFFCPFRYFLCFSWIFSKEKSAFFSMNFPCGWSIFPFLGEYFRIFFVSSDKEFHPSRIFFVPSGRNFHLSGFFLHGSDARAPARA